MASSAPLPAKSVCSGIKPSNVKPHGLKSLALRSLIIKPGDQQRGLGKVESGGGRVQTGEVEVEVEPRVGM